MYSNILVPLDGSQNSERALPHARDLAKALGATLHLVQVVSTADEMDILGTGEELYVITEQQQNLIDEIVNSRLTRAEEYLAGVKEGLEAEGVAVSASVLEGQAADRITEYAERENIDLTVISTRGQGGIQRFLVGSTTDRIIRSARHPILAVPPGD